MGPQWATTATPLLPITVCACGVFWISISPGCIVVFIWGGWVGEGVSSSNWLCVCQSNIQCDQWAAHRRLVWCVLRGHRALTAARGANPALHSPHIVLPPLVILLTTRTQAVQSITASPSPPPPTPPLVSRSLLSIYQHCVWCWLHHSLSTPQHLHVCNCIRFVMVAQLFGPPQLVLGQRAPFHVPGTPDIRFKYL